MSKQKYIFIDRDGVLNQKPTQSRYVRRWEEFRWATGAKEAVRLLNKAGYKILVISNQAGIGYGVMSQSDVDDILAHMQEDLKKIGASIEAFYICPHRAEDNCACRKPKAGLLKKAQKEFGLDFKQTPFIGDDLKDEQAAQKVGSPHYRVGPEGHLIDIVRKKILPKEGPPLKRFFYRIKQASLFWRVLVSPRKWSSLAVLVLSVAGALFEAFTIGLAVPIVNGIAHPEQLASNPVAIWMSSTLTSWGLLPQQNILLFSLIVLALSLFVSKSVAILLQQYALNRIAWQTYTEIKSKLFYLILQAEYAVHIKKNRGTALSDLTQMPEAFRRSLLQLGKFVNGLVNLSALVGLMFFLSIWTTVILGAVGLLLILLWKRTIPKFSSLVGKEIYELRRRQAKLELDAIDGIKVVKSNVLEPKLLSQQTRLLHKELGPYLKMSLLLVAPATVNEFIGAVVIIGLAAITFLYPSLGLSFSILVAFLLAMRRAIPTLSALTTSSVELNKDRRALEISEELEAAMPKEESGVEEFTEKIEKVELDDVSFSYRDSRDDLAVQKVNLTAFSGKMTALVGPSGSGKSTLANLLLGLFRPLEGKITYNQSDLRNLKLSSLRRKIGYLSQDVYLFNGTLAENMTLWDSRVTQADLERAARLAQLHDFVTTLPDGYQTPVGDRGVRLSGGQCQRVAIARSILKKPEVLILDEATSALDNLTEKAIHQSLLELRSDAIIVVIAHRLSTVKDADHIVVLKEGRIIEQGSHQSLMANKKVYSDLYRLEEPSPR